MFHYFIITYKKRPNKGIYLSSFYRFANYCSKALAVESFSKERINFVCSAINQVVMCG